MSHRCQPSLPQVTITSYPNAEHPPSATRDACAVRALRFTTLTSTVIPPQLASSTMLTMCKFAVADFAYMRSLLIVLCSHRFDEQDGPYRPLDRPSLDTALSRSQSDNAGASAKAPLSSNDNSAPLGPSALLSILDRGRSFAHLRHNSHGFNSLASVQAHAHR